MVKRIAAPRLDTKKRPGHPEVYDWDKWCEGGWYTATLGKDIDATNPAAFRQSIKRQAGKRGLAFEYNHDGKVVEFRFFKPDATK
ncbi:hypothetical protein [Blastopirellula retiformator]|uniref:Uncharacterized protein n=1 Tax=Blastopirellula retiformator TaxID=2527970 RepID=A0A5C5UYX2_9BACT|nr:hypothetical protein [Blastopirellula retiformator]TWT30677.1 hypothetical protein Enr8_41990 [Blastopirellula retiformator]